MAVGQAKADVGCATGRVHAQFFAQATHKREYLMPGRCHRTDRHDQRVHDDVMCRNAEICGTLDNLFGYGKPDIGIFGNTRVIIGNRHDRHVVFLDQRQHQFKAFFLTGDGIQQRATLAGPQSILKRAGHGTVDANRQITDRLHARNHLGHQDRLNKVVVCITRVFGHLVGENRAGIHVQDVRARVHLCNGIRLDTAEIAAFQFFGQNFAARRVNSLSDDTERLIKADDGRFGFGFDNRACH